MGGQHRRHSLAGEQAHQFPRLAPGLWIEPSGRFVQEEEPRPADHTHRHVQATALPAREFGAVGCGLGSETDHVDELPGREGIGVERGEVVDDLVDREFLIIRRSLRHHPHLDTPLAFVVLGVASQHAHRTAGAPLRAREDVDGGRLAGAVGPQEGEYLSGFHLQVDIVDRHETPVCFPQSADGDGTRHHRSSFPTVAHVR